MDFEDDPWAKQSPEDVKNAQSGVAVGAAAVPALELPEPESTASETSHSKKQNDNDDDDAWGAGSDNEEDDFVEAASRMSLSNASLASGTAIGEQDASASDDHTGGTANEDSFDASTPPVAGPSKLPLSFSPPAGQQLDSQPPLDDFGDDDDGFGDFGQQGDADANDDDFGAFDEAGTANNDDFGFDDEPQPSTSTQPAPSGLIPKQGVVDLDSIPDCNIDFDTLLSDPEGFNASVQNYFEEVYPDYWEEIDTSEEAKAASRRIDPSLPPAEIVLGNNKEARHIYNTWFDEKQFPVQPWDWKRSNIRIEALRALGEPVNLDDFAPPAKMAPLVLPSIHTTSASPTKEKTSFVSAANPRSRPSSRSASPGRLGQSTGSAPGSPARSPVRQSSNIQIPPIDLDKCTKLANITEQAMNMRAPGELELLRTELQNTAIEASQHLTALLEQKELLAGQNQTYNAMIQDLVVQAQKLRSSSSPGASVSRKPSLQRQNSTGNKPPSRPASPANSNLKSSLGRSSAAQSSGAGKDPSRRTSLW